jgi:hypothetical protein
MTNSAMLEQAISDSGVRRRYIMDKMGIKSYITLRAKINNKSDFTAREINILCEILHLNLRQRNAIFFA